MADVKDRRPAIYGERAPIEKVIQRARKICGVGRGGEILKILPSLRRNVSHKGNVYYTRWTHVQYKHMMTGEVLWREFEYKTNQRGGPKLFACTWNNDAPRALEVVCG